MQARLGLLYCHRMSLLADVAVAAKKKPKKEPPEITQVLELPKDPPQAVVAQTERLVFQVSPLSSKGLLVAADPGRDQGSLEHVQRVTDREDSRVRGGFGRHAARAQRRERNVHRRNDCRYRPCRSFRSAACPSTALRSSWNRLRRIRRSSTLTDMRLYPGRSARHRTQSGL